MDFFFTQSELYWLDHLLPEAVRRLKEDESRKDENGINYGDEEMTKIRVRDNNYSLNFHVIVDLFSLLQK
jgi:hypothetical protein